ncbi:MAG TPA: guanylate kinase [Terriglobales bacterium]|nr:guanylate kinase [Terriglobales bacterium]
MSGIVFIVSAPSGSGKSTLTAEMMRLVPGLEFSISYTTRKPRGSERNGVEYFFVPKDDFERMIGNDEFLEHACVFGDHYGTARSSVEKAAKEGHDLLLDIDVQGAAQVKRRVPGAVSIFILPPSRTVLEQRLRLRSKSEKVDEEVITRRLSAAGREIENYPTYDYILVNDQLDQSIDELSAIILAERIKRSGNVVAGSEEKQTIETAERCRLSNVRERVQQILVSFTESEPARSGH